MQLDCSWASSGTTSNDITSICDVHHQQCSHLGPAANRHLSPLAEKPGSDRAINLSISSTARRARAATWMGLLSKATDCSAFPGFGGNCVHGSQARFWQRGSMQGEWKLKSGLSSDNCHLGRKSTLGKKEGPRGHPPRRVPPGWKDAVKVTCEAHSQTGQWDFTAHTYRYSPANNWTVLPSCIPHAFISLVILCHSWFKKKKCFQIIYMCNRFLSFQCVRDI